MTLSGFDCWGFGPAPAAAKAAARSFRTWYSSYDGSKDGPVDGPAQYAAAGIWSICNFETTIDRVMTGGADGGAQDMMHAINEYVPRGMPPGAVVILSADEAIPAGSFAQALEYYRGARHAAAGQYLTGSYGEQALLAYLKQLGAIDIGWRSMSTAWPGGAATAYCDIIQTGSGSIGGVEVDYNTALVDFVGQWMPGTLASQGDTVVLTIDDMNATAQILENRKVGLIPPTPDKATTTLGVETASNPARWAALNARLDDLAAKVAALGAQESTELADLGSITAEVGQVNVDANQLAEALAGNPTFAATIAKAVVEQIAADLKPASSA